VTNQKTLVDRADRGPINLETEWPETIQGALLG
jgi:hypothetical protein